MVVFPPCKFHLYIIENFIVLCSEVHFPVYMIYFRMNDDDILSVGGAANSASIVYSVDMENSSSESDISANDSEITEITPENFGRY